MPFIQLQLRRGLSTEWQTANNVLADGEIGLETDTRLFKIGNGNTTWNLLSYGGLNGASGYSGYSGRSGFSGYSGVSGYSGPAGPSTQINATNTTSAGTYYPVFVQAAGSNQTARVRTTSVGLTYNPGTGEVGATDFNSLSDMSLKENIQSIKNPLDVISKLNPVSFSWKDMDKKSFGFIAQEIEKILPEIVTENDGLKALSYTQIIPFLVEAIKELQKQVDDLKNK